MEVYLVKCKSCQCRWKLSERYIDDGLEVVCPKCGSSEYILDATDEIEGDTLDSLHW